MAFPILTTAANSIHGIITYTSDKYGERELIDRYEQSDFMQYLNMTGLVDVKMDAQIVDVYESVEEGTNTAVLDATEYQFPASYKPAEGYEVRILGGRAINSYDLSSKEIISLEKAKGGQFAAVGALVQKKAIGALNNIYEKEKILFRDEILNKFWVTGATNKYKCPDTKPVLADDHAYANGVTFDNTVAVAGTAYGEAVLDALRAYESGMTGSDGADVTVDFDTVLVAKGSANEKEAWKIHKREGTSPTTVAGINIYEGTMTVKSIRGMKSDMIVFIDSSKERIVKLHYVEAIKGYAPVWGVNNAMSVTYEGDMGWGISDIPLGLAGVAGVVTA